MAFNWKKRSAPSFEHQANQQDNKKDRAQSAADAFAPTLYRVVSCVIASEMLGHPGERGGTQRVAVGGKARQIALCLL